MQFQWVDLVRPCKRRCPFAGDEHYTGEFRTGKREQAPYVRTLIVPQEWEEDAVKALGTLTGQM